MSRKKAKSRIIAQVKWLDKELRKCIIKPMMHFASAVL